MELFTSEIEEGAMLSSPCYETHSRGKNWLAKIHKDPASPGGLGRTFQQKARGAYYYFVTGLNIGDVVEFGADYYTGGGSKRSNRFYGIVRSLSDTKIEIEEFSSSAEAFKAKKEESLVTG
jgi:hypothetical protein